MIEITNRKEGERHTDTIPEFSLVRNRRTNFALHFRIEHEPLDPMDLSCNTFSFVSFNKYTLINFDVGIPKKLSGDEMMFCMSLDCSVSGSHIKWEIDDLSIRTIMNVVSFLNKFT